MEETSSVKATAIAAVLLITIIVGLMFLLPIYNVWRKEQRGKATLSEAEWSKRVQIEQAKANIESQKLNAEAEVVRAKGAAEAISIEAGRLTPGYIQYLWVQKMNESEKTTIYIPTEGNLPILEAGRR